MASRLAILVRPPRYYVRQWIGSLCGWQSPILDTSILFSKLRSLPMSHQRSAAVQMELSPVILSSAARVGLMLSLRPFLGDTTYCSHFLTTA